MITQFKSIDRWNEVVVDKINLFLKPLFTIIILNGVAMKIISALLLAFFVSGCQSTLTEDQKNQIAKEVETTVKNFFNPKTLNYDTYVALRADKEGYLFAGDGVILTTDYRTFQEFIKKSFENVDRFIELEPIRMFTYVLSDDAATCTFEFKGKFLTTGGDTLTDNGCWTMVFKKFDNEWKVIQENGTHTKERKD